jgi:hypothetical protein
VVHFSRGYAGKRISHLLFTTHLHPAIREWLYASTPSLRIPTIANFHSLLQHVVPSSR